MRELASRLRSARRSGLVRTRPMFEEHGSVSERELSEIESALGCALPSDLKAWLLVVGFGDIDDTLSFRREWFASIDAGEFKGGFRFAQDDLGNFLACPANGESVVFLSRSEPAFAVLAPSFRAFLAELEARDYRFSNWVASAKLVSYAWSAA